MLYTVYSIYLALDWIRAREFFIEYRGVAR